MLATFLPWVHVPIVGSVAGSSGDGWITLLLFLPAAILCFIDDKLQPLAGAKRLGAAIPGGLAALIALLKISDFKSAMNSGLQDNPFAEVFSASVQIGIGLYLVVLAGVALPILAFVLGPRSTTTRSRT